MVRREGNVFSPNVMPQKPYFSFSGRDPHMFPPGESLVWGWSRILVASVSQHSETRCSRTVIGGVFLCAGNLLCGATWSVGFQVKSHS